MKSILLTLVGFFIISCFHKEAKGLQNKTLSHTEMIQFCEFKDPKHKRGYVHPHYCSKAIFCEYRNKYSPQGQVLREVVYEEFTCPECSTELLDKQFTNTEKEECPFGYKHWDEDKQTCRKASHISCRQEELPKVKSWGRADLAQYCEKETTSYTTHPHYCGKFLYCEWDKLYQDLYVEVGNCPDCEKDNIKCPEGYEYHTAGGNCALPHTIPEDAKRKCRTQELSNKSTQEGTMIISQLPKGKKPIMGAEPLNFYSLEIEMPRGSNKSEFAQRFCQNTTVEPTRYPHPQDCHKYMFCWYGLYDKEGDLRETNQTSHLEILCSKCDPEPLSCPFGFQTFDSKSMECTANHLADCNTGNNYNNNVNKNNSAYLNTVGVNQDGWESPRKPLMNESEVTDFCLLKAKPTSRDYLHPKDKSCTRYITCWFQQNLFAEKLCDKCDKSPYECPSGYLHFDEKSQECQNASNSSCIAENLIDTINFATSSTPEPVPTPATTVTHRSQVSKLLTQVANIVDVTQISDKNTTVVLNSKYSNYTNPKNSTDTIKPKHQTGSKTSTTGTILLKPKSCNPRNYVQRGYCKTYFKCNRKNRHEDMRRCSGRLFWNPDRNSVHGGVCDYLKNIDNYTLYQYKKDPQCVLNVAYFRGNDKPCSGTYFYNHPQRTEGKEVQLQCPEDLLWSKERKTCAKCGDVKNSPGGEACCTNGSGNGDYSEEDNDNLDGSFWSISKSSNLEIN